MPSKSSATTEAKTRRAFWGWQTWVMILLTVIASILAWGVALLNQSIDQTKLTAERSERLNVEQNRFVDNFSNYMNCLIVNEDEVVLQVGEEAYVEICKQLLYRGITPIPETIKADPSLLTTTTTTTTR